MHTPVHLYRSSRGLDLSEKRAYVREALHAVLISPAGKGVSSHGKFNPDLLQLVWRT